jgi:hypothetical protein
VAASQAGMAIARAQASHREARTRLRVRSCALGFVEYIPYKHRQLPLVA